MDKHKQMDTTPSVEAVRERISESERQTERKSERARIMPLKRSLLLHGFLALRGVIIVLSMLTHSICIVSSKRFVAARVIHAAHSFLASWQYFFTHRFYSVIREIWVSQLRVAIAITRGFQFLCSWELSNFCFFFSRINIIVKVSE